MSRPPLPIGTWGSISTRVEKTDAKGKPITYLAKARIRDHDGHVRPVTAVGRSKTGAETNLKKKLQDRARTNQSGALSAMHKINHLLDLWEKRFEGLIADGKRSPTSLDTYRRVLKNHIRPALGELRIGEATTPRIDAVLAKIKECELRHAAIDGVGDMRGDGRLRSRGWRMADRTGGGWEDVVLRAVLAPVGGRSVLTKEDATFADWVGACVDLSAIRRARSDFLRFWAHEVDLGSMPRNWIRWAVNLLQATEKVTGGNPSDEQHSSYLVDADYFLTADRRYAAILEAVREDAPFEIAKTIAMAGDRERAGTAWPLQPQIAAAQRAP
ncbi:hypothetical protein [Kribbella solani]|uniref:hypothetical protein n=1 Tax=Kribbella solani TaxID=236067 RepID=UPI0029B55D10|nr:hypothetical protein [Kribbella solani]MDX2973530.1 hypothetical protein [Kribbella solani]